LTPAAAAAFARLRRRARAHGFELAIASGHRNFERQLSIWNAKASGRRAVLDEHGVPLQIDALSERQLVFAILRWSALPGASRHHWGSDMDIYDAAAVPPDYRLQLCVDETVGQGAFAPLHRWLDGQILAQDACGFYRPYAVDSGGIAPEPWHLSFAPESRRFEQCIDPGRYRDFLSRQPLSLRQTVLEHFEEIYQRFIDPASSGAAPTSAASAIKT
jgi:hypothetical protein